MTRIEAERQNTVFFSNPYKKWWFELGSRRGARQAAVCEVTKSRTWLNDFHYYVSSRIIGIGFPGGYNGLRKVYV